MNKDDQAYLTVKFPKGQQATPEDAEEFRGHMVALAEALGVEPPGPVLWRLRCDGEGCEAVTEPTLERQLAPGWTRPAWGEDYCPGCSAERTEEE